MNHQVHHVSIDSKLLEQALNVGVGLSKIWYEVQQNQIKTHPPHEQTIAYLFFMEIAGYVASLIFVNCVNVDRFFNSLVDRCF